MLAKPDLGTARTLSLSGNTERIECLGQGREVGWLETRVTARFPIRGESHTLAHARAPTSLDVRRFISEQQRMRQVKVKRGGGTQDHAWSRLAAIAIERIACNSRVREVWAVLDRLESDVLTREMGTQRVVYARERCLVVIPPCDARLIGDHHQRVAGGLQPVQSLDDARHEDEILQAMQVSRVDVDDSVAVEEGAGTRHHWQPTRMRSTSEVVEKPGKNGIASERPPQPRTRRVSESVSMS